MNPSAVTRASNRSRSPRFGASAVKREGVDVSSCQVISHNASTVALP